MSDYKIPCPEYSIPIPIPIPIPKKAAQGAPSRLWFCGDGEIGHPWPSSPEIGAGPKPLAKSWTETVNSCAAVRRRTLGAELCPWHSEHRMGEARQSRCAQIRCRIPTLPVGLGRPAPTAASIIPHRTSAATPRVSSWAGGGEGVKDTRPAGGSLDYRHCRLVGRSYSFGLPLFPAAGGPLRGSGKRSVGIRVPDRD